MSSEQPGDEVRRAADRFLADRADLADPCRCEELLEHLFEYLDAEMTAAQRARLTSHVEQCPRCHEAADVEQHVRSLIRRSCTEKAPQSLRLRVISQISVLRTSGVRAVD